ncbi:MAG: acyltransferase [Burkholderiales bacterium]|nr:acyltransferase [Burkholderiales bacterium]
MIKKYIWRLFNLLNKYIASPRMVLGYTRADKIYLPRTRISNTVDIINPKQLDIADNVFIWHNSILECSNGLTIEEGCQIGANVLIATHSSHIAIRLYGKHYINQPSYIGYITGTVKIGKYSFIGPHATLMPGSQLGKGSIVAAYSLVKGTFPDFAIIAGNPAQKVGDTREMDKKYLATHPELAIYYNEWANT